jgi:hypothetical protein
MKLLLLTLVAFACAPVALAADAPDSRLDATATEIAGHSLTVACETDEAAWSALLASVGDTPPDGEYVRGFTAPGSVVHLSPAVCLSLRFGLHDAAPASSEIAPGVALEVLLFESLRQRTTNLGVGQEAVLECQAVGLVRAYGTKLLKIPAKVAETKTVYRWKRVLVHGKWVRKRVAFRVRVLVANPALASLVNQAERDRRRLQPPYFTGNNC